MTAITAELGLAIDRVARSARLLVALDFDGTLAPLVDDPADSRALPESLAAVSDLVGLPLTTVAVVSGRGLGSLDEVAALPGEVLVIGSHGAEVRLGAGRDQSLLDERDLDRRRRLGSALVGVDAIAGAWIEEKPTGFAVHTRLATAEDEERARALARAAVDRSGIADVTARTGNHVLEFSVIAVTKGDALDRLRAVAEADAVVFIGDDVTDEDGFHRLHPGDLGIKCGSGETVAAYRVSDPEAVARALHRLARARSH